MDRPSDVSLLGLIKAPRRLLIAAAGVCLVALTSVSHAAAGRTPGSFSVDSVGGANYVIPIWAPRGPNGLQPNIALAYNSNQLNGYVGYGWNVSGLSSIYRCARTVAQDEAASGVSLTTADAFCIDGQRLQLTSAPATQGMAASTYQTEIATFSNVTAYGQTGGGPQYFIVQTPNGTQYEYGNPNTTASAQILLTPTGGSPTANAWMLDKITDSAGNTMLFTYTTISGAAVPLTISWTPTASGATSYQYAMNFSYGTNVPQSSVYQYVAGAAVTNTQLLQSIAITYTGAGSTSTVKQYNLTYTPSPGTSRNQLARVTECADATLSNCLSPSTFQYQTTTAGVSTGASSPITATFGPIALYDFNGDGIKDLLFQNGTTWYVAFGTSTGYGPPVSTTIVTPQLLMGNLAVLNDFLLVGDVLGTHKDGILVSNGSTFLYYTANGTSSFSSVNTNFPVNSSASYALATIRGNGLPDLVSLTWSGSAATVSTNQNTSSGGAPSFSSTPVTAFTDSPAPYTISSAGLRSPDSNPGGELRTWDFNGDGRQDLLYLRNASFSTPIYVTSNVAYELLGQSNGTFVAVAANQFVDSLPYTYEGQSGIQFINFNNDKCTDAAVGNLVFISACDGTVASQQYLAGQLVSVLDVDGDGRTDAVVVNPATGNLGVQYSLGATVNPTIADLGVPAVSTAFYGRIDIGGSGLDTLSCFNCTTNTFTYYSRLSPGIEPDVLISATDGFGNSVQPGYVTLYQTTNSHYTGSSPAPPEPDDAPVTSPLNVVSSVVFSDPSSTGATYTQTHYYTNGWENLEGRGFLGFSTHEMIDSRNSVAETWTYNMVFPTTGLLTDDVVTQSSGTGPIISSMIATPTYETLNSTLGTQRYFPYASNQTVNRNEVGGTKNGLSNTSTTTSYGTPDSYGNFSSISSTITDEDSDAQMSWQSWTTAISTTYQTPNLSNWCVDLPSITTVTQSSTMGATVAQTTQYSPDPIASTCRQHIITHVPQAGSDYTVTETVGYDTFGNVANDEISGAGLSPPRTTYVVWATPGQFPTSVTDPSGAQTQFAYTLNYGKINSETDPNNQTTSWTYTDGFGRKTQETRPDHTYTTYMYGDCASLGSCLTGSHGLYTQAQVFGANGVLESGHTVYGDSVGRPLVKTDSMLTGGYARNEVRYDPFGNTIQQASPCVWTSLAAACPYWTANTYDTLNRLLTSQHPLNATADTPETTHYGYAGRTTTITDPNENVKTLMYDPNGWLRETMDGSAYAVTIDYDAAGNKTRVTDSSGKQLWSGGYTYGVKAFLTSEIDMYRGAWGYTYDSLGELANWTDAKDQHFSETYDALSRPLTRLEPDLFTQWTWGTGQISGTAAYNVGKLQTVCTGTGSAPTTCTSSGYAETKTYDNLARLLTRAIQIPGDMTYTYGLTYDPNTGLLSTLTYPTTPAGPALVLQYGYASGILQTVATSTGTTLWTANNENAAGGISEETLGNHVQVNHAFDPATYLITGITAGVGGGTALQNESFMFDGVGNLTQREDNNLGFQENIFVDAANRLDHTTLNANNADMQMSYNPNGSISSRQFSAVAPNTDDYASPNSLVAESSNAGSGGIITWTSFNQPSTISGGSGVSSAFFYGPNHQRWQQQAYYAGSAETTTYIGGLLEKVATSSGTAYRHFIPAGNGFVVYLPGSPPTVQYVTGDHLSSTATITDTNGNLVLAESFGPWGARRSPTNWTVYQSSTDAALLATTMRQGFTGQEHLDNLALINMNGRTYQGTEFMSPDPHITDPANPQNYNGYGYVYDNPLSFVDPSGFDACFVADPEQTSSDPNATSYDPVTATYYPTPVVPVIGQAPAGPCFGINWQSFSNNLGNLPPINVNVSGPGGGNGCTSAYVCAPQTTAITGLRKLLNPCNYPALTGGFDLQLNYGFLKLFGAEGQVSLSITTHGQVIWTETGGGVVGINQGLVLSGGFQAGVTKIDPPALFAPTSSIGGELIVAVEGGANVGASEATDGSGGSMNLLGRAGFATGGGLVAGANYQSGFTFASPSLCSKPNSSTGQQGGAQSGQ